MAGVELGEGLLQLLLLLPRWCVQETISPTFFVFTFEGTLVLVLEVVAVVVEAVERVGGQGGQKVEASRPDDALGDVIAVERQVEDVEHLAASVGWRVGAGAGVGVGEG